MCTRKLLLQKLHVLQVATLLLQLLLCLQLHLLVLTAGCSVPICCCLLPSLPRRCCSLISTFIYSILLVFFLPRVLLHKRMS